MKCIYDSPETAERLTEWNDGEMPIVGKFFFLGKCQTGMTAECQTQDHVDLVELLTLWLMGILIKYWIAVASRTSIVPSVCLRTCYAK